LFNENNTSKIENIISELQGTNPDKPNYVGPQQPDSTLSQLNTSMLPFDLGVQPSYETPIASSSNMNDELREGMFGTITPNFPNFVGPQEFNSPADQIDTQFLAQDLGIQPTSTAAVTSNTPVISNTPVTSNSVTSNTSNNSELPALTPDFLQSILVPPPGVNPSGDVVRETNDIISPIFGNATPESLGFTEVQSMPEMQQFYGGGGGGGLGKYYDDFSSMAYAKGGQIYRGRR